MVPVPGQVVLGYIRKQAELVREQANQEAVAICGSFPCGFPCKLNKPFPPQVAFGHNIYLKTEQTRTVDSIAYTAPLPFPHLLSPL